MRLVRMCIDTPRDVAMAEGSASEVDAQNESFKEVLVVFRDRRRPVKFQVSNDPSEEKSSLLQAIQDAFSDCYCVFEPVNDILRQTSVGKTLLVLSLLY